MKTKYLILLSAWILLMTQACDKIDEPYSRKTVTPPDTSGAVQKVLLEDYTGHKCPNCPEATFMALDLVEQYEGKVIVMAVHAGFFSWPGATGHYTADYRTDEGDELDVFFGVSAQGNPKGLINRIGSGTERVIPPGEWDEMVASEVAKEPVLTLELDHNYAAASGTLNLDVNIEFLAASDATYNLCAFIIEDSIQSPQMNNEPSIGPTPDWLDYWHRHMLRGSMNGTWGQQVNDAAVTDGEIITVTCDPYQLDNTWVDDHCSLIVFVYNTETFEIMNVEEVKIKSQ